MKKTLFFLWEVFKIAVIALAIVMPIRYFLFQPFLVKGESMAPNFGDGDYLIVDELSYRFRNPERGEIIIFNYTENSIQGIVKNRLIKRVIGLPGETIEIKEGKVSIYKDNEKQVLDESDYISFLLKTSGNILITLNEDEYFVLGDNRSFSKDSRVFGVVNEEEIIGKVFVRAWPLNDIEKFEAPSY
ncbi:MAG: signal peptidase I [Patescibacteria group bacterium]|nr:signal peptidase I [Patescibacteria group bacterium]